MGIHSQLSRRDWFRWSMQCAGGLTLAHPLAAKPDIPVALQLFSVREQCGRDLPGVLRDVAKFGYAGVEFAGYYGRSAAEIRRMLDDYSLRCCGSHTPLDQLTPERFDATVEFNKAAGSRDLIVPGLPAQYHSPDGWRAAARLFNSLSNRLRPAGMRIGYHNHALEFTRDVNGEMPWDIFFGNTSREVTMQLDLGNARLAGVDPQTLLRGYPGRARSIHVKDCLPGRPDVMLGSSDFDWASLLRICRTSVGTEWYIIEHESHDLPAMEAAQESLRQFRRILSVS